MTKRENGGTSHGPAKRAKVEPPGKILTGYSENVTLRERKLFGDILNLVTKEKENPTTSQQSLLSKNRSALYMEFDHEAESLYLWIKCYTGPRIKFLVHPVFRFSTLAAVATNPLIAFSENFVDSENWRLVKSTLTQIFGGEDNVATNPDFLFAFSRAGEYVHLRSYQILHLPDPSNPEKILRLSGLVDHLCFMVVDLPIPNAGVIKVETAETMELFEDNVFIGSSPATLSSLHTAVLNGSGIHFMLDDVMDLSAWTGYGTCLADFKDRNQTMFSARVLGTAPDKTAPNETADFPNDRYKHVIRSLLTEMVGLETDGKCIYKLDDSDICLKGTSVKLSWRVELHQYSVPAARSHRRRIKAIISDVFSGAVIPRDLLALLELLDSEHLTPGEYLCTHCCLMEDLCKGHLITDVHDEFRLNLSIRQRLLVAEALYHHAKNWRDAVKSNKLLNGVLNRKSSRVNAGEPSDPSKDADPSGPSKDADPSVIPLVEGEDKMSNLTEVHELISHLRHFKVHIADQLKALFKDKNMQLRESVRVIESKLPDVLHILQNELRYILGDSWFSGYFPQQ